MATSFSGVEIVDIAKSIEASGEAFYDEVIEHLRDPKIQKTFTFLRDEEKRHEAEFERLLSGVSMADEWRTNEEYLGYMRALGDNRVFPSPDSARVTVRNIKTAVEAIDFAIRFEKESILFLQEMRTLVTEDSLTLVDSLMDEERKHLTLLTKLRSEY